MTMGSNSSKVFLTVSSMLLIRGASIAQTIVGGVIDTNATWTTNGSPYIVDQSVIVINGATLEVLPGVTVKFEPLRALLVSDGILAAIGTPEQRVSFTANSNVTPYTSLNRWGYIGFSDFAVDAEFDAASNPTSGCILVNSVIEYAGGAGIEGAIHVEDSSPYIANCIIRSNYQGGVYLRDTDAIRICGNTIADNSTPVDGGGMCLIDVNDALIQSNIVTRNAADEGSGLYLDSCESVHCAGNEIISNRSMLFPNGSSFRIARRGGGVYLDGCNSVEIAANFISSNEVANTGGGIHTARGSNNYLCNNEINQNRSDDNVGGIWLGDSDSILAGNTISGNSAPSAAGGLLMFSIQNVTLTNNLFTMNATGGEGGALYMSRCQHITMTGDVISNNAAAVGSALYLVDDCEDITLSSSRTDPTYVIAHTNSSVVYNDCPFSFSVAPDAVSNVDGRRTWWGTRDTDVIEDFVYDFFDDAGKGIVVIDPHITFSVTIETNGSGIVSAVPEQQYYEPNEQFELCASPSEHWYFSHWSGDISGTSACFSGQVSGDLFLSADFNAFSTSQGTPHWWLANYSIGTNDLAASIDHDDDTHATWKEYVADTNPTNASSVLALTELEATDDALLLSWSGGVSATQFLETASSLAPEQTWVSIFTNHPPTPEFVTYTNSLRTNSPGSIARIRVAR